MQNEQNIIDLLRSKDKEVISVLYDKYAAALYGVAVRIVNCEEIAQDVMQDAFIKIWKKGAKYDQKKGSLFTWMLNITRNTAIDKTRSIHYRQKGKVQPIDYFVNNSEAPFLQEMSIPDVGLAKKIETLDTKYKTIIDLIYFNGYTQREVSEHLSIPLGTVKSSVRIALRKLKNALADKNSMPLAKNDF